MNTEKKKKRKEFLEAYKNRCPEMGIISYRCKETDDVFLGISKDTKAGFSSNSAKLLFNGHPNKELQNLWNKYGSGGFELSVVKVLKYDNPNKDHTRELENLRDECLASNPNAKRIWR